MNTHDDELERMLGRDLHHQVDGMSGAPLAFDDVKRRAGRIRRNRRVAAGVGVAAALAVIVPSAMTAGGMPKTTEEIQPAPPRPEVPVEVPVEVSRTTLTLQGISRGDAPAIEYFTPQGVVLPEEGAQPLPESYQALVHSEAEGGWIAFGAGKDEVLYLSEEFEQQGRSDSGNGFTSTPERDYVAWTAPEAGGQRMEVHSTTEPDEAVSWEFPELPTVDPVGILGPDSVVYRTLSPGGETTVGLALPDGSTTKLQYVDAKGADPVNGLISVQTEVRQPGGCFAVVEAATLEPAWDTCEYQLGAFSPDGRYVMATAAESSGIVSVLHVLDARTGDRVAEFASAGPEVVNLVGPSWESADTIIASAGQGTTLTLVRLGVDGTLEEVADPVEGDIFGDHHYYLGVDRTVL